ncbi:hypothetical protein ACVXZ4_14100 [Lacisediminihabitans sp. FW035]
MAGITGVVNTPGLRFHYRAQTIDTGGIAGLNGLTVQPSLSNVSRRPFRDRGASASRRPSTHRRLGTILAITGFAVQSVALMGAAAVEPTAPGPLTESASPSPSPTPTSPMGATPDFSFSAPSFSPTNAVRLTGTKDAGAGVAVTAGSGSSAACTIAASDATDYSCYAPLASGRAIVLSAIQTLDGVASAPLSATVDVLGAPTIDGEPDSVTTGLVSGYGFAGSTVSTVLEGGAIGCSSVATDAGYWSCALTVPSGRYVVRVEQSRADLGGGASSSLSGSLSLVVDRDAPAAAAITAPAAGSRVTGTDVTVSGTGEVAAPGLDGIADLYLDNIPACRVPITGGAWSCVLHGTAPGAHSLLVIQRDAAGNFSMPSTPVTVYFGAKPGSIVPVPPVTPPQPDGPASPGQPSTSPPPSETPGTPAPDQSGPAAPPAGSPDNWGTPTTFGALIPTLASSVSTGNLFLAPLLVLVFVVLVALPLRLLAGALRGRIRVPSLQFTGRNRSRSREPSPALTDGMNPWIAGAVPLAAAAALILIAGGIDDQVRYLRLSAAVVVGLAVLNVVGVAVATRAGSRWQRVSGRLRFVPLLLLAALLAALLSRATGIHPPVIAGVLIGVGFASTVPAHARAIVGLVEIGTVTALAAAAWLLHGLFASASGFWALFAGETLATVALAGLGSVVVLVLPIATLPGRAVFEWSRPAWLASVTVAVLIGSVVILGSGEVAFPIVGAVLGAGAFAALSVAVWGWLRFVDPAVPEARA